MNSLTMANIAEIETGAADREVAARSALYQLFGHVFLYPHDDGVMEYLQGAACETTLVAAQDLPYRVDGLDEKLRGLLARLNQPADRLADQYTAYFDNCTGRALVSLRESDYSTGDKRALWEDLVRFYEYFGMNYDFAESLLPPDHLTVQLDTLQYLTFLEALTDTARPALMKAELDFVTGHLLAWTGEFSKALCGVADQDSPYGPASTLLLEVLENERAHLTARIRHGRGNP
jgi:putative dimethyl sulfoxide reductase chaperone